jgi:hypothetical protein
MQFPYFILYVHVAVGMVLQHSVDVSFLYSLNTLPLVSHMSLNLLTFISIYLFSNVKIF